MKKASLNDVKICYSNGFPFLYSDGKAQLKLKILYNAKVEE